MIHQRDEVSFCLRRWLHSPKREAQGTKNPEMGTGYPALLLLEMISTTMTLAAFGWALATVLASYALINPTIGAAVIAGCFACLQAGVTAFLVFYLPRRAARLDHEERERERHETHV